MPIGEGFKFCEGRKSHVPIGKRIRALTLFCSLTGHACDMRL